MSILIVVAILICFLSFAIFQKLNNAKCMSVRSLAGRTALVTGGTAGMGLEVATELARRGARVLVACPSPAEGGAALRHIARAARSRDLHYQRLDLASLASTRRAAAELLARETRLDILINNAGVAGPTNRTTDDNLNYVMQVNYFGTFLLTLLLLPLLEKSGQPGDPSRIVNTSSVSHRLGRIDKNNLHAKEFCYTFCLDYCNSKLCVVLFTRELARILKGKPVVVNSVDPGAVGTRIFESRDRFFGRILTWTFFCLFKTPWEGAQTALHVAVDEQAGEVSGEYLRNCRPARAAARAYDGELAREVWEESLKIVKLNEFTSDNRTGNKVSDTPVS